MSRVSKFYELELEIRCSLNPARNLASLIIPCCISCGVESSLAGPRHLADPAMAADPVAHKIPLTVVDYDSAAIIQEIFDVLAEG